MSLIYPIAGLTAGGIMVWSGLNNVSIVDTVLGVAQPKKGSNPASDLLGKFGAGGGGGSPASDSSPSNGAQPQTGSGWSACLMTWYDPALGGTNSASGAADPHSKTASGEPYDASAMTCAAPPNYPFGTQIQFAYNKKMVTCKVNDRGGAIQGAHFDLGRAPATALGIISVGAAHGQFRILGH